MDCSAIKSRGIKNALNLIPCKYSAVSTEDICDELRYPFFLRIGNVVGIEVSGVVIANAGTTGAWELTKAKRSSRNGMIARILRT